MTDEPTSDDQSEPDEQKADFAARAEKIRGIGPERARELAEEFADELTADGNGTPDNDVKLSADQAGAPANEVNDVCSRDREGERPLERAASGLDWRRVRGCSSSDCFRRPTAEPFGG